LEEGKVTVYGKDEKQIEGHDKIYWTKEWWRWILSIPRAVNPSNERTGEFSGINQATKVFNLGGGPTGPASSKWRLGEDKITRSVAVPQGMPILVPVAVGIISTSEFPNLLPDRQSFTDQYLQEYAGSAEVTEKRVMIDDVPAKEEDIQYLTTDVFEVVYGESNIFDAPAGPSLAASDGYWVFIQPPERDFKLQFSQKTEDNPVLGYYAFEYDITCNIEIVKR
jgi:hypothetical protein